MIKTFSKFALYYGYDRQEVLSENDLIIVEPKAQTDQSLKVLRQNGASVLAYISFMEVAKSELSEHALEEKELIWMDADRPFVNDFGNHLVDVRNEKWKRRFLETVSALCADRKFDGLFIDTVGNLESEQLRRIYNNAFHVVYRELLKMIRQNFPHITIIQNNGLDTVMAYSKDLVNGICWENPPIGSLNSFLWVALVTKKLIAQKKEKPDFIVLILEEDDKSKKQTHSYAKKHQWLYYKANKDYL